jgi:Ca2+-binding RTX toxin-like protein
LAERHVGVDTRRFQPAQTFERTTTMAISSSFNPATGVLAATGDNAKNAITFGRDAAGTLLVNGGAVAIAGGKATVANTSQIQGFGQDANDTIALDETNGALPAAELFGGAGNDTLTGGSGAD